MDRCTEKISKMSFQAPQWKNPPQYWSHACDLCTKVGILIQPCDCSFHVHQRCFDRWKGSAANHRCPKCKKRNLIRAVDADVTFPMGSKVLLLGEEEQKLVTVVGVQRLVSKDSSVTRVYTVSTPGGTLYTVPPSQLVYVPMCRVCGRTTGHLEMDPCECRGSICQFVHGSCLSRDASCGVCGAVLGDQSSRWTRFKNIFYMR